MYFDKLAPGEKELIFKGLKRLVEEGDTAMFHNGDPGHPVYLAGANKRSIPLLQYADIPTNNSAFLMLRELTLDLKEGCSTMIWWKDLSTWQLFCEFAVAKYRERRKGRA